jgi:hypothetical protein
MSTVGLPITVALANMTFMENEFNHLAMKVTLALPLRQVDSMECRLHKCRWNVPRCIMGILGRRNLQFIIPRFTGDRWANTELAITNYEEALTVSTRDADPSAWAAIKLNLGNVLPGSDGRQSRGERGGGDRVLSQCSERFSLESPIPRRGQS